MISESFLNNLNYGVVTLSVVEGYIIRINQIEASTTLSLT
ncbi:MAG: DUF2292 domain-containing protein [Pedobacter sp.]|nr:MAG: DUF2292 domain-containing protein [Pedobacter sp.]